VSLIIGVLVSLVPIAAGVAAEIQYKTGGRVRCLFMSGPARAQAAANAEAKAAAMVASDPKVLVLADTETLKAVADETEALEAAEAETEAAPARGEIPD
jgi:hypothetical protein